MVLRLLARLLWVIAVVLTGPAVVARASAVDLLWGIGIVLLPLVGGTGVFLLARRLHPEPAAGRWRRMLTGTGGVLVVGAVLGVLNMGGMPFSYFYMLCLGSGLSLLVAAGVVTLLRRKPDA